MASCPQSLGQSPVQNRCSEKGHLIYGSPFHRRQGHCPHPGLLAQVMVQARQMDKMKQLDSWQLLLNVGGRVYVSSAAPGVLPGQKEKTNPAPHRKALGHVYVLHDSEGLAEI